MRKIERKPLSDVVYKALLRKVMDGSFAIGSPLREERLCETLGVSRTPLREALIRLAREGVLERLPNKGCVVRRRSSKEIEELMECRAEFECLALRKYFALIDLAEMKKVSERLAGAKSEPPEEARRSILEADERMHELIVLASSNSFLQEQIARMQALCRPYRIFRCDESADQIAIADERLRIVNAIIRGDLEAATAALRDHFGISANSFLVNNSQ